jgi:dihydroflavonol-4-reductase
VTGDVLDPGSVQAAVEGCDAIINAAAVYSLDPRNARSALATNARATEIMLEAATVARLDSIVHVSSDDATPVWPPGSMDRHPLPGHR